MLFSTSIYSILLLIYSMHMMSGQFMHAYFFASQIQVLLLQLRISTPVHTTVTTVTTVTTTNVVCSVAAHVK